MVLDAALLNTQHYKIRIKGKVEQSREWSSILTYTSVWELLKSEPSGHPWLRSPTLLYLQDYTDTFVEEFTKICPELWISTWNQDTCQET